MEGEPEITTFSGQFHETGIPLKWRAHQLAWSYLLAEEGARNPSIRSDWERAVRHCFEETLHSLVRSPVYW
ncbi:hypothetical protein HSRCO_1256 [Halanaeroarchaeum sp. HSR-CO]|nr:hypothetical protein HSRCO_1256 [Halanaeroarchaeum sp. HSR-CO]